MSRVDPLAGADLVLLRHGPFERVVEAGRLRERVAEAQLAKARALADRLAALDRPQLLLSSPRPRAVATGHAFAERLELTLYTDPDLDEVRLARDPDLDEATTGALWSRARAAPARPVQRGAEAQQAAGLRALATLRAAVRAADGALVIAISHGGLIEALLQQLDAAEGRAPVARTVHPLEPVLLRGATGAAWFEALEP